MAENGCVFLPWSRLKCLKLTMPRQFLPIRVVAGGRRPLALFEDFGGFFLAGGHPFASRPSTGIDKQQVCACSHPVGISAGLKLASTRKEAGRKCL